MLEVGQKVRVKENFSNHEFKINEEVVVERIDSIDEEKDIADSFRASNGKDWWMLGEDEVELL